MTIIIAFPAEIGMNFGKVVLEESGEDIKKILHLNSVNRNGVT